MKPINATCTSNGRDVIILQILTGIGATSVICMYKDTNTLINLNLSQLKITDPDYITAESLRPVAQEPAEPTPPKKRRGRKKKQANPTKQNDTETDLPRPSITSLPEGS